MPPVKKKAARSSIGPTKETRKATLAKKYFPNWGDWKSRITVTLYEANCLIHNVSHKGGRVEMLKIGKDPRVKKFNSHLNTIKNLQPHEIELKKAFQSDPDGTGETRVYLRNFIHWIKTKGVFSGELELPSEFCDLNPRESSLKASSKFPSHDLASEDKPTEGLQSTSSPDKATSDATSANVEDLVDPRRIGTMARILLALVIEHYGYRPEEYAGNKRAYKRGEGVYEPIRKLCGSMKFVRPMCPMINFNLSTLSN
jgi:hypothetical protein